MYLLTFITLLIGLIGIYAQVIALQTARMVAQQTGIAMTLIQWHSAAVSMARSVISVNASNIPSAGCSLTVALPPIPGIVVCPSPVTAGTLTGGTVTSGVVPPYTVGTYTLNKVMYNAAQVTVSMPSGYDTNDYQFYSILYPMSGTYQVMTLVPAPIPSSTNPTPGYLAAIPSGILLGTTLAGLTQQLSNTSLPNYTYGPISVSGTTATLMAGGGYTYCYVSSPTASCASNSLPALLTTFSSSTMKLNGGLAIVSTP